MIQLLDDSSVSYTPRNSNNVENEETATDRLTEEEERETKVKNVERPVAMIKPILKWPKDTQKTGPAEVHSAYVAVRTEEERETDNEVHPPTQSPPLRRRFIHAWRILKTTLKSIAFVMTVLFILSPLCLFVYKGTFGSDVQGCKCAVSRINPDLDDNPLQLINDLILLGCSAEGETRCKTQCQALVDNYSTTYKQDVCQNQMNPLKYLRNIYYKNCGRKWKTLYREVPICCRDGLAFPCPEDDYEDEDT